jgi:hypothetical protein
MRGRKRRKRRKRRTRRRRRRTAGESDRLETGDGRWERGDGRGADEFEAYQRKGKWAVRDVQVEEGGRRERRKARQCKKGQGKARQGKARKAGRTG